MSYGTTEEINLEEKNNKYAFFIAGINQNVTAKASYRNSKNDGTSADWILGIDVTGQNGERKTIREKEAQDPTNQLRRLKYWVKEITGEDKFPSIFNDFKHMAETFSEMINGIDTLLEIKLLYDGKFYKGYPTLEMPGYLGCVKAMSNPVRLQLSASEATKCIKPEATPTSVEELNNNYDVEDVNVDVPSSSEDNLPF
jgi:hypothetical protein